MCDHVLDGLIWITLLQTHSAAVGGDIRSVLKRAFPEIPIAGFGAEADAADQHRERERHENQDRSAVVPAKSGETPAQTPSDL